MTLVQVAGDTLIHLSKLRPVLIPPPTHSAAQITSFKAHPLYSPRRPEPRTGAVLIGHDLPGSCTGTSGTNPAENVSWSETLHGTSEGDDHVPAADVGLGLEGPYGQICCCGSLTLEPNSLLGIFLYIIYNNYSSPCFVNVSLSTLPRSLKTQCDGSSLWFWKGVLVWLHSALPCNWMAAKGTGCGCDYPADAPD